MRIAIQFQSSVLNEIAKQSKFGEPSTKLHISKAQCHCTFIMQTEQIRVMTENYIINNKN